MKRILKGLMFSLVSAGVVYIVLIGLCTYFFPEPVKNKDEEEDDDFDDYIDLDLESKAWNLD